MVRTRFHTIAKLGHFNDMLACAKELDRLCVEKGLAKSRFLTPAFGEVNHFIVESEYPDWAAYGRENEAFFSDAKIMAHFRSGVELSETGELPWSEAEEEAPNLA